MNISDIVLGLVVILFIAVVVIGFKHGQYLSVIKEFITNFETWFSAEKDVAEKTVANVTDKVKADLPSLTEIEDRVKAIIDEKTSDIKQHISNEIAKTLTGKEPQVEQPAVKEPTEENKA